MSPLSCQAPPWPREVLMPRAPLTLGSTRTGAIPDTCLKPSTPYWANHSTRSTLIKVHLHQSSHQNKMSPASKEAGWGPKGIFWIFFPCYPLKSRGRSLTELPKWKLVTKIFPTFLLLQKVREGGSVAHTPILCCWNYRSDGSLVIFSTAHV